LKEIVDALLELIFPSRCAICRESSPLPLCSSCQDTFEFVKPPFCLCCGIPRLSVHEESLCANCRDNPPSFDMIRSACIYGGTVKKAIAAYKFQGLKRLSAPFAILMTNLLESECILKEAELMVPVPLHRSREKERGYNQSGLLADLVSSKTGIRVQKRLLIRTRRTETMNRLKRGERFCNLEHAFSVQRNGLIEGKKVLVIDDIITTGATLHECARTLKEAGARQVFGVTIARTLSKSGEREL
jgi:competence protein ComFC